MVIPRGLGDDSGTARGEGAFGREEQVIGVDHAGRFDLAGGRGACRVPLAANVVAVEPDAYLESTHFDADVPEECKWEKGGLWGVDGARGYNVSFQSRCI